MSDGPRPCLDSACHRALRCAEILDEVLSVFRSWDLTERHRTSRNFALVCRGFSEPTLAVLWQELLTLEPLGVILDLEPPCPSASWPMFEEPSPTSWARFDHYASRIHTVHDLDYRHLGIERSTRLLERYGGHTFLPSLRAFSAKVEPGVQYPALPVAFSHLVSTRSLTDLRLLISPNFIPEIRWRPFLYSELAMTFTASFPCLHSLILDLRRGVFGTDAPSRMISLLSSFPSLRHLTLLWPRAFWFTSIHLRELLSAHPGLESLQTEFRQALLPTVTSSTPVAQRFRVSSLRGLVCHGDWNVIRDALSSLECPVLEVLTLTTRHSRSIPTMRRIQECVEEISQPSFAPHLKTLDMDAVPRSRIRWRSEHIYPTQTIADALRPLAAMAHLDTVHFAMRGALLPQPSALAWSDGAMLELATTLGRISHLSLELSYASPRALDLRMANAERGYSGGRGASASLRLTPRSLVHFASHCPRLVTLAISSMDMCAGVPSMPLEELPRCETLRRLCLTKTIEPDGSSRNPPLAAKELAEFLHGLFPNLDAAASTFREGAEADAAVRDAIQELQERQRGSVPFEHSHVDVPAGPYHIDFGGVKCRGVRATCLNRRLHELYTPTASFWETRRPSLYPLENRDVRVKT
ncbi:hypothetical protein C8Q77DRAFT_1111269 [Trametes polyzona]|nr:hypothetical protein C8Q77DRAFT_1111269 [Trametes polyzona]